MHLAEIFQKTKQDIKKLQEALLGISKLFQWAECFL